MKLGADLFNLNGREYLLVIDYYSNYPEVALLEEISSKAVINKLKSIFSRHGIPSKLITDNGRQFISSEFKSFTDYYNINHSTSSPTLARSNGKAEKGVGIVKKLLKKAAEKGEDQYLAMLNYRAAPLDCGYSPAELLMNRRLRTRLPDSDDLLPSEKITSQTSQKQAQYYNVGAKELAPLLPGDSVRVRSDGEWRTKAVVEG